MKVNNIATYLLVVFVGLLVAKFFLPVNGLIIAIVSLLLTITSMLGLATSKLSNKLFHETELAGIVVGILFLGYFLVHDHHTASHSWHEITDINNGGWKSALAVMIIMSLVNIFSKEMFAFLTWIDSKLPNNRTGNFIGLVLFQLMSSLIAQPGTAKMLAEFYLPRVKEGQKNSFGLGLATGIGTGGGFLPFTAPAVAIVWSAMQKNGWTLGQYFTLIVPALFIHVCWISWRLSGMLRSDLDNQTTKLTTKSTISILFVLIAAIAQITDYATTVNLILLAVGTIYLFISKFSIKSSIQGPLMIAFLMLAFVPIGNICKPIFEQLLQLISSFPFIIMVLLVGFIIKAGSAISDNALLALIGCALPAASGSPVFTAAVIFGALAGGILLEGSNIPNIPIRQVFAIEKTEWPKESLKWYLPSMVVFPLWILCLTQIPL